MDLLEALQQNPHLQALSDNDRRHLADRMRVADYEDGHTFIREGETGDTIFLILDGDVQITRKFAGQQQEIERLQPGAFFGLLALVDTEPRGASCIAVGPVTAAALSRAEHDALQASSPEIALAFQRALGAQLAADFRNIASHLRELLNTPPKAQTPVRDCDVAVIGGGPLGLVYATWVRRFRPETHVVVLERRERPPHKVGESTLSTTIRCFNAMGLNHSVLRRLFGNKAGLRWFYTESDSDQLQGHFDIIDIEETYQVERPVLETAMQYLATSREGIELLTGTRVLIRESNLDCDKKELLCEGPDGDQFILRASVVCDASGPASVIPRHLGIYRKEPERYDSFNYNSYFAYFRPKKNPPIDFWSYPATRHICFKEGWLWFISLISWENNPPEKVEEMIRYLIDLEAETDEDYPTRDELSERFGLTSEPIFSIGFTLRDDRDISGMPIQERFEYWVNKYPAIKWVLDHFELVDAPYEGKQRSHFAFMNMLHDVEQVAGDGWCVIGDAAMFINPFFSLGLNYGTGTAYMAARDTVAGLNAGDVSQRAFANYQQYATDLFRSKLLETDMYYRSFNHLQSYERALALVIAWGITDVLPRGGYSDSDPYVFDPLNPEWLDVVERLVAIQREGEQNDRPPSEVADDVTQTVNAFIEHLNQTRDLYSIPLGNYTRFYGNDWQRSETPRYEKGRGDYEAIQCSQCSLFYDDALRRCPYCGKVHQQ